MDATFNNVLYIGPFNEFGGMGSVLNMYKKNMQNIKYISTNPKNENSSKVFSFINVLVTLTCKFLLDRDIKIIHIHSAANASFVRKSMIGLFSKFCGKKTVFHIHSGSFEHFYANSGVFRPVIQFILKKMDCVICLSDQWFEFYTKKLGLEKVIVLGNPVEVQERLPKQYNSGILNMLFLGMICDNKGIFDLIEYLRTNKYFLANLIQLKIGGNKDTEKLLELLSDPILASNIQFCGWVKADYKHKLLSECDVLILPSYFEGLPVSILEAMAYSKPIIATNVGGIPSIVKDGFNGWLFTPGSFKELDFVFDQIFHNPSTLTNYGNNSFQMVSCFSPEIIHYHLSDIYAQLIGPTSNHLTYK